MPNKIDFSELNGLVFSRLTVVGDLGNIKGRRMLLVDCVCGNRKVVFMGHLKGGKIVSCGCNSREKLILRNNKHGFSKHQLNNIWRGMKDRCYKPNSISYPYYGAKGIEICDEWLSDISAFFKWAICSGYKKGLLIDRVKNELGYSPSNCRWLTPKESNRNTTANRILEFNGEKRCVAEWAEVLKIPRVRISDRINKLGWSVEDALTKPNQNI